MGRKKKFGEESDFVSVRVPKSKRREYRNAIKKFVEKKFAKESDSLRINTTNNTNTKGIDGYRKFEEFIKKIEQEEKEKV